MPAAGASRWMSVRPPPYGMSPGAEAAMDAANGAKTTSASRQQRHRATSADAARIIAPPPKP